MAIDTNQRYIAGLSVFDTYNGLDGTIVQMNLDTSATNPLCPMWMGAHIVVLFSGSTGQIFTLGGKRVEHNTGLPLSGVTLLTLAEKTALLGAGYPSRY